MKKRQLFAAGTLAVLLLSALAGCGTTEPAQAYEEDPEEILAEMLAWLEEAKATGDAELRDEINRVRPRVDESNHSPEQVISWWKVHKEDFVAELQEVQRQRAAAKAEADAKAKAAAEAQAKAEAEARARAEERARLGPQWNDEDFGPGAAVAQTFEVTNADEWAAAVKAIDRGENNKNYVITVTGAVSGGISFERVHSGLKISLRSGGAGENALIRSSVTVSGGETLILRDIALKAVNVNITKDGNLVMKGGEISGNSGRGDSGNGVNMRGGTFAMSGGEISGNSDSGVYMNGTYGRTSFILSGGKISGNSGSGVYVFDGAFAMSGGEISGNSSGAGGGGVNMIGGTFAMSGGKISGNSSRSSYDGGGVYMRGGTFTMSGGTISGNSSRSTGLNGGNGGGVYMTGTNNTFTMTGGKISGNSAINEGGGVYLITGIRLKRSDKEVIFTMSGGEISGNSAKDGGGVYNGGIFTMSGGTIHGSGAGDQANKAGGQGAALYSMNHDNAKYGNGSLILEGYRADYINDTLTGKK